MRQVTLLSCLLLTSIVTAMPALSIEIDLGVASPYNAFMKGDFKVKGTDTQGRVAVGGNFVVNKGHDVGKRIHQFGMGTGPSLVVGGNVIKKGDGNFNVYEDGPHLDPHQGDIVYAGKVKGKNNGAIEANLIKVAKSKLPVDFDAAFAHLNQLSNDLAAATVSGSAVANWSALTFTATTTPSDNVYVFNVTQEQINSTTDWYVNGVNDSASIVFNVSNPNKIKGKASNQVARCKKGKTGCVQLSQANLNINGKLVSDHLHKGDLNDRLNNQVLYNFSGVSQLNIAADFYGSILAPSADIKGGTAHIYGQVIGKSWQGNMQLNYNPFTPVGTGTTPVPAPATIWVFTLALALIYVNRKLIRTKRKVIKFDSINTAVTKDTAITA